MVSNWFGDFAMSTFSPWFQNIINNSYVKLMKLDMSEFRDPSTYETLNRLFTRRLEVAREINTANNSIISPVDAKVTSAGRINHGFSYQIKGMEYKIENLFGEHHKDAVKKLEGGEYINFYLSPKDYHRYHMPTTMQIKSMTHIAGKLYPVNIPFLYKKENLFIENERVIIEGIDRFGNLFIMVLVGALNVGKMIVSFEPKVQTNTQGDSVTHFKYKNLWIEKGKQFGYFQMGSTVLLFMPKGIAHRFAMDGDSVRYGKMVAKYHNVGEQAWLLGR